MVYNKFSYSVEKDTQKFCSNKAASVSLNLIYTVNNELEHYHYFKTRAKDGIENGTLIYTFAIRCCVRVRACVRECVRVCVRAYHQPG